MKVAAWSLIVLSALAAGVPAAAQDRAGKVINFSLLDDRGQHFELRRTDAKVVVLYFTSLNCPIARQSMAKLQKLQEEFADQGVAVWLVNATPQEDPDGERLDMIAELALRGVLANMIPKTGPNAEESVRRLKSLEQMKDLVPRKLALGDREEFRRQVVQARVGFLPLLRDENQAVTHHFGVTRTCETIAIDTENATVVYRGAIDDQMQPGAQKPEPTERYLFDALSAFLAGRPIAKPKTTTHGCLITFDNSWPERDVSYSRHVAPVLKKRCLGCHSPGKIGPFAFSDYQSVKRWSAMMQEVLLDRRMPPWDADPHYGKFANDPSLTADELHTLLVWIKAGCPRGEGEDSLADFEPQQERWKHGQPDYVVPLKEQQAIPATGVLEYRYLDSDFVMPEDAWLRAAVVRPDNLKVVHHVITRIRYPRNYREPPSEAYMLSMWAPGMDQFEFPAETGVFAPKGSRFNFEVHYTTNGEPQTDQSEMGLYLAKTPPKLRLELRATETRDLQIPPGASNAQHSCSYCFQRDAILYDLSPHMHLRGAWFKFQLLYPDGRRETALSVPRYNFNWQTGHTFAEPKHIPAGTWLICTGGFDNSRQNAANPNPKKHVVWGLQTSDEMFMGFITAAEPRVESGKQEP